MSGGIMALFGVCLGAAILELALPGEEKESPRRLLHFFAALLVLLFILRPLLDLPEEVAELGDLTEAVDGEAYEEILQEAVTRRSVEQLRAGLLSLMEREFGVTAAQCEIGIETEKAGELKRVTVTLRGGGLLQDPRVVEARLQELLLCEVEVR